MSFRTAGFARRLPAVQVNAGLSVRRHRATLIYKTLYKRRVKRIEFMGTALDDLRAFPDSARRQAGYQLDRIQQGLDPDDWKPMVTIGAGVREIRVRDEHGAFRIVYIAKLADRVIVLHCFQKKTQKTPKGDIDVATRRYKQLDNERRKGHRR